MAIGIITEYNPFHNGHQKQLQLIQQATSTSPEPIIACMSGNIMQRGELAIMDKWQRAKAAVAGGVNLVIELPTLQAVRSAQDFAQGGVELFQQMGIITYLAFGTEYPNLEQLQLAVQIQEEATPEEIKALMQQGLSYGAAMSQLVQQKSSLDSALLTEPNTILAFEYLKALNRLNSKIIPLPILRTGASHNSATIHEGIASGTTIRQLFQQEDWDTLSNTVPLTTLEELQHLSGIPNISKLWELLQWQLQGTNAPELAKIYGFNEGLEYKLLSAINQGSYTDFIQQISTKRYPTTRIQRLVIYILLQLTKNQVKNLQAQGPQYLRVLAFDDLGRQLLRTMRDTTSIPIITRVSDFLTRRDLQQQQQLSPLQQQLLLDIKATNLRELCCPCPQLYRDMLENPLYIKSR